MFGIAYTFSWSAATLAAVVLVVREPRAYGLLSPAYARSLLVPWKLLSFLLAGGFFVFAAPYTGDPTWDHVDGAMMSVLTYLTAPWAVGTLVRVLRRLVPRRQAFVAAMAWLLSASWCYDGYLFWRDGRYPATWSSNLVVSSALYAAAGMMWSLTHVPGRGVVFDFMTAEWFSTSPSRFGKIAAIALLLAVGVGIAMLPFAWETLSSIKRR